jgi:hypothetical protein
MSNSALPSRASRRRLWPVVVLGLVAALAVVWTALWFYAAAQAKTEFSAWRERERQAGRQQDCASLSVGGYPLGIKVRCAGGDFETQELPGYRLALQSAAGGVEIYDPKLMTSELTGPPTISQRATGIEYSVSWNVGQASMRGLPQVGSGTVLFDDLSVRDRASGGNEPVLGARRFEAEGRRAVGSHADARAVEIVMKIRQAVAEKIHPALATPADADVTMVAYGIDDLQRKPLPELLRQWQAHGGAVEITRARLQQDDVIAAGTGALRLTEHGNLDGNFQVTMVNIDKMLKRLNLEQLMSEGQVGTALNALDQLMPGLGAMARRSAAPGLLAMLGHRSELEGKPATTLSLRFVEGRVFLGPVPAGTVPPLF